MALSITPEDLRTLYNDLTSQGYDHQTLVNAAMQNYGINLDDALKSSGPISYVDKINSGPLETAAQPSYADYQASQDSSADVAPLTSAAYQYATGEGGIGLDAMNQNIQDFFAASPTEEATRAAMAEYGVSDEDIRRATGKSLAEYYPAAASTATGALSTATATGALPTTSFDAFGNQKSGTWTEDRYNPNDPASKYYIADPNAGRYVFDPVTGKPTLVSSTGATSVTGATGNDTVRT